MSVKAYVSVPTIKAGAIQIAPVVGPLFASLFTDDDTQFLTDDDDLILGDDS